MSRDTLNALALILAAAFVGLIGWSGELLALPLSLLFATIWSTGRSRLVVALASAAYFLAASRGLPQGVGRYYGYHGLSGYALWVAASLGFVAVYTVAWSPRARRMRPARLGFAGLALAIPPFGIVGWAHPITAAGVLFPGWGWCGLIATAIGMAVMTTRRWPIAVLALGGIWAWSAACSTPPILASDWIGVDTDYGAVLGRSFDFDMQKKLGGAVHNAAASGAQVVVLPESALGYWTATSARFWKDEILSSKVAIVAGASVVDTGGYDNVLVAMNSEGDRIVYRQRMPVPVSMWRPWRNLVGQGSGAHAWFFSHPVVEIHGASIAPLICYEQLLVWPILQSMLSNPDLIVAVGNTWWADDTSIMPIQRSSTEAWGRLFNIPVIFAFNK